MEFTKKIKLYFKKKKSVNFIFFLAIFASVIAFTFFASIYKIFYAKSTYIYTKVKVGQGFWWAATAKPSIWYLNAIKKGDQENDLLGRSIAEIEEVKYYPSDNTGDTYNIYLTIKLKVNKNKTTKNYIFKRSDIAIGSSIEIDLPSSQITGTIIDLSSYKFKDIYTQRIVKLVNYNGYDKYFPYKWDSIKRGEKYFDGTSEVFKILDKNLETNFTETQDSYGNLYQKERLSPKNIIVKAKVKLLKKNDQFIFGEEQIISGGQNFYLRLKNSNFSNFFIASIE